MIAREGIPFVLISALLTLILLWIATRWDSRVAFSFSLLAGLLAVFVTFFFRDPQRSFNPGPNQLIAPADGKVVQIKPIKDHPFIGKEARQVSIFLSVFDVHVNRVPTDGVIQYVKYNPGKFFAAFEDKASKLNEQTEIGLVTSGGQRIVFKQIAGLIARRIVCHLNKGDTVQAGERFGLIRFGSRTDLIVPADCELTVKIGDNVKGGQTVVGRLSSKGDSLTAVTDAGSNNVEL
jgi:phosphatidylserine decarboxylase